MADKNNKNGFDSIVRKKFIYIGDVVTFIKILKSINFNIKVNKPMIRLEQFNLNCLTTNVRKNLMSLRKH